MGQRNIDNGTATKKARKSRHLGLILSAIIVLALAYLVYAYGSLPYSVITAKQLNASTLKSIMLSKVNSAKTLNLSYNGSVSVNSTDPSVGLYYNKSNGNTYLGLMITQNNGHYGQVLASLTNITKPGTVCTQYRNQYGLNDSCMFEKPYVPMLHLADEIANFSTLGNVSLSSYSLQIYRGQPCYSLSGTATMMANGTLAGESGFIPAKVNFNTCLSAQYNIPLELSGYAALSNGAVVLFSFNEDNFSYGGNAFAP